MLDEAVDIPGLITTISGKTVNVISPMPDMIDIDDIACALSNYCRYVGHLEYKPVKKFYSVAEHSFLVSLCVGDDPETQLWALLHDAPEFVLGDLASPVKHLPELSMYRLLERRLMAAVCGHFYLPLKEPAIVTLVDTQIRVLERIELRGRARQDDDPILPITIGCWTPEKAQRMFMERFHALVEARNSTENKREQAQFSAIS